eukprot:m.288283 g.288283  ORF g.288283 m.288283 type:complete len:215 (+) comp11939_c0_seq1:108-752(+)
MALFDSFTRDFNTLMAEVNAKIGTIPDLSGEERRDMSRGAGLCIEEAEELVEQMELDLVDAPPSERPGLKSKIGQFQQQIKKARDDLKRASTAASTADMKNDLFAYENRDDARRAMVDNTERLNRSSRRLEDGHRVALETTDVAMSIMGELHDQRETIQRSRGRLRETDKELGRSGAVLNRMILRAKQNKVVAFLIIVIAIGLIGLISYLILSK